ncbi:uncharacterized protein [Littorina saxatilis]
MSKDSSPRKLRSLSRVDYSEQTVTDDENSSSSDVVDTSEYSLSDTSFVAAPAPPLAATPSGNPSATMDYLQLGKEAGLTGRDLLDFVVEAEERKRNFELEAEERKRRLAMEEESHSYALANPEQTHAHQVALAAASVTSKKSDIGIIADKIRLPYLDDGDDVDTYLTKFERIATQMKWEVSTWALRLSGHLKGKAAEVYTKLSFEIADDYDVLKDALLKAFHCTAKTYREKFRAAKRVGSETYEQVLERSKMYLDRWLHLAKGNRDFDSLYDLIRLEQFINGLPADVKAFVKERSPGSADAAAAAAQAYLEAHEPDCKNPFSRRQTESVCAVSTSGAKKKHRQRRQAAKSEERESQVSSPASQDNSESVATINAPPGEKKHCNYCNRDGHEADYCHKRARDVIAREKSSVTGFKSVNATPGSGQSSAIFGCVHVISADDSVPKLRSRLCPDCQAATAGDNYMVKVKICGIETEALRDTGSNISLARRDIVPKSCFTGKTRDLTGAFGPDSRVAQIAHVDVETPYYSGVIEINVVNDLNTAVLIGNHFTLPSGVVVEVPTYGPRGSCAAVTRAQAKKDACGDLPLDPKSQGLQKTRQELIDAQESDPSLKRMRDLARDQHPWSSQGQGRVRFLYRANVLNREYCGSDGVFHRQVCVPHPFRSEVLTLGHSSPMAGHLAARRTLSRIWSDFYWPGMCADVRRFVASCDSCQRTVPRGRLRKVALEKMPLVDVPFEQVVIDLIGPIHPPSGVSLVLQLSLYRLFHVIHSGIAIFGVTCHPRFPLGWGFVT